MSLNNALCAWETRSIDRNDLRRTFGNYGTASERKRKSIGRLFAFHIAHLIVAGMRQ
jgi:hypothetical protein